MNFSVFFAKNTNNFYFFSRACPIGAFVGIVRQNMHKISATEVTFYEK